MVLGVSALLAGCGDKEQAPYSSGGAGGGGGAPAAKSSYYADAKPIFDAKCTGCHTDGGIAPFSLKTYDNASAYASLIKQKVVAKEMPPWPADDACASYYDRRSLTDEQIGTLAKWVDDGAIEGDPEDEGAAVDKGPSRALSRVDLTLQMPEAYTPQKEPDDYRCFVLDWPYADDRFVTGFGVKAGVPGIVHHAIAFLATPDMVAQAKANDDADPGPGYACFGGPSLAKPTWLAGWVPGGAGIDFPAGTGVRVPAGSKIVLQIHYNTLNGGPEPDRTSVDLKIDQTVEHEAHMQPWTNPQWPKDKTMDIPAGQQDVMHQFAHDPTQITGGKAMTIYSSMLHMHQLGASATLQIARKGGGSECMLRIPEWKFHWQGMYNLLEPKTVEAGDSLSIECHWDNSAAHQPVIDGSQKAPTDVNWGESTSDEMCLGVFYYTTM
jgi:mono/diheme cytochrome c family protein